MKGKRLGGMLLLLVAALLVSCSGDTSQSGEVVMGDNAVTELQVTGNGTAELVMDPVHEGIYSAKLAIPEDYSFRDLARIALPLDGVTLDEITTLSFWCYVDEETPVNIDGAYWGPYLTFEIDTDGRGGYDTWIIGGGLYATRSSAVWVEDILESGELFYVSTVVSGYTSPFPVTSMGTLAEIKAAMGPDGVTSLGDYTVTKVRVAIGNWGEGGPVGPVIYYVDHLVCNGELIF